MLCCIITSFSWVFLRRCYIYTVYQGIFGISKFSIFYLQKRRIEGTGFLLSVWHNAPCGSSALYLSFGFDNFCKIPCNRRRFYKGWIFLPFRRIGGTNRSLGVCGRFSFFLAHLSC